MVIAILAMSFVVLSHGQTIELPPNFGQSTKTVNSNYAVAGNTLTFTINLSNTGPGDAAPAYMVDPLPQGLNYVAGSAGNGAMYNAAGHYIFWSGPISAGTSVSVSYQVTSSLTVDQFATNYAAVGTAIQGSVIITGTGSFGPSGTLVFPYSFGASVLGVSSLGAVQELVISPTQGGVITGANGLVITIPPGAVNAAYRLVYNPISNNLNNPPPTLPPGLGFGAYYFGLHAFQNGVIQDSLNFNTPPGITITISYGGVLGSLAFPNDKNLVEDTLALYFLQGGNWGSGGITTTVFTADNRAEVHLSHLSQFALLGKPFARLYAPMIFKNYTAP
ncbi:MAG: DUF11 domain-containing protein [Anaerolineae bacterium]